MKKLLYFVIILIILAAILVPFYPAPKKQNGQSSQKYNQMIITSPDFKNGEFIPETLTCDGQGLNPNLEIKNVPQEAKSLTIIVDDPDAPKGTFVHWVAWNIDPETKSIEEGKSAQLVAIFGSNSGGTVAYIAPCPPKGHGVHHYVFKIYALDTILNLKAGASKTDAEKAMTNHILDQAELIGLYSR